MRTLLTLTAVALTISLVPFGAKAADYTLTIKNHRFTPSEIKVPANKRVKLTVVNDDATPEEFDSDALKVEKVLPGKGKGTIRIGPLRPGKYPFVGEYHESTAKGAVIAE